MPTLNSESRTCSSGSNTLNTSGAGDVVDDDRAGGREGGQRLGEVELTGQLGWEALGGEVEEQRVDADPGAAQRTRLQERPVVGGQVGRGRQAHRGEG